MKLTQDQLEFILVAIGDYARPAEKFLNDLIDKESDLHILAAYCTGDLGKAVNTLEIANTTLLELLPLIESAQKHQGLKQEFEHNLEVANCWRNRLACLQEKVEVAKVEIN